MPYDTVENRNIAKKLVSDMTRNFELQKSQYEGSFMDLQKLRGGALSQREDNSTYLKMVGLGCMCEMEEDDSSCEMEGGALIYNGYKYDGSVDDISRINPMGSGFSAGGYSAGAIKPRGFSAGAKKRYMSTGRPRGRPRKLKGGININIEELKKGKESLKKKIDVPKEEVKKEGVEGLVEEIKKGVKLRPKIDVPKVEKPKVGRERLIDEIKKGISLKPSKPISVEIIKEEIIKDKPQTSAKRKYKIMPVIENIPMKVEAMGKPKRQRQPRKLKGGVLPVLGAIASAVPWEEVGTELYKTSGLYEETPEELEQHKLKSEIHGLERQAYKDSQWANIQKKYKGKENNKEFQRLKKVYGKGKMHRKPNEAIKKRSEIVKKVMKEKGLSMIEASKYVKQNKLY